MSCILPDCDWTLPVPALKATPTTLATVFGLDVMAAVESTQRAAKIEAELEKHLKTHSLVEWVTALKDAYREADEAWEERNVFRDEVGRVQEMNRVLSERLRQAEDALRARMGQRGEVVAVPTLSEPERTVVRGPVEPETPRYSADLPEGVVGIKGR